MPLTAITKDGQRIDYRTAVRLGRYACPDCKGEMVFKAGTVVVPHFTHLVRPDNCRYASESEEHMGMKGFFARIMGGECELEKPIGNAIADVVVRKLIVEIQCSPLSLEEYYDRHMNAVRHNMQILWILEEDPYFMLVSKGRGLFVRIKELERAIHHNQGFLLYFFMAPQPNGSWHPVFRRVVLQRPKWRSGGGDCTRTYFYKSVDVSPMQIRALVAQYADIGPLEMYGL